MSADGDVLIRKLTALDFADYIVRKNTIEEMTFLTEEKLGSVVCMKNST